MEADIDWREAVNDFHPGISLVRAARRDRTITSINWESRKMRTYISTTASSLSARIQRWAPHGIAMFASAVFLDSLRFKFTDYPNTQEIFGRLDGWASSFGAPGLFGHTGLFSQYVIGSGELIASSLLVAGIFLTGHRYLQGVGAAIGLLIMTGAISFHLFTPLGVDPNSDGGGLFMAACLVWCGCIAMLAIRRAELAQFARRVARVFVGGDANASARQIGV